MSFTNPFVPSTSRPGHGTVHLNVLPPHTPVLSTISYQYPLKLIAPEPLYLPVASPPTPPTTPPTTTKISPLTTSTPPTPPPDTFPHEPTSPLIHCLYILTYGGGLVAGDAIHLTLTLAPSTRLILLTQGSTKIFKSPSPSLISRQYTHTRLSPGAALCYLPDPVQPFRESAVEVCGVYELETQGQGAGEASLCVLDWVCEGRRARGEHWSFHSYRSKNEVYAVDPATQKRRLLLRDNQILDSHASSTLPRGKNEGDGEEELASRMDGLGAFGTLILHGPLFASLGDAFIDDFAALPRIGGRKWDDDTPQPSPPAGSLEAQRAARRKQEERDGVVWSTARVRGFVMVKFGAREVEGARRWVRRVIEEEGSVVRRFGERAVLCLK